jgi:hypothetical protein
MTRAFVSSVENGRLVPSIPSLLIIARRLGTTAAVILEAAEGRRGVQWNGQGNEPAIARQR